MKIQNSKETFLKKIKIRNQGINLMIKQKIKIINQKEIKLII